MAILSDPGLTAGAPPAPTVFRAAWDAQRGHVFPWAPVAFACGIAVYFGLRVEPAVWVLAVCAGAGLVALWLAARLGSALLALAACAAIGCAVAGARSHLVAGPVLDFRYYGPVEGRIVAIDRSASDAVRLTLDRVVLQDVPRVRTPTRVRVSLHGDQRWFTAAPGLRVMLTGHLLPPGGAVEPGGFDFRRHAWFLQLGAVGYTRTPVLVVEHLETGQWVFRARMWVSDRVRAALPGETGAFAAAVTAGDRSAMGQDTLQDLRDTNLAHLLAISGLHMGLLAGFVFGALRVCLVLIPATRHLPAIKSYAAFGALVAATGYLALSGGNVATERAYVMAAVALCAVMLNRRALSLRSVAIAALIVLTLRPEALLSPGFQMSFAATTALVAAFEVLTELRVQEKLPRWSNGLLSLFVSSAVAGLATAPVGMTHFNTIAHYGLVANLISVPVMGILVVPMAVLGALLMPFGLDWVPFRIMGLGLDWILWVAGTVAAWDGAVRSIVAPGASVLPLIAAGGLILCLWRGAGRLFGFLPMLVAAVLWARSDRPDILIADTGAIVGIQTDEGRALSRPRGAGFIASVWLENDGDRADQAGAAARWRGSEERLSSYPIPTGVLVHVSGTVAARSLTACQPGDIVVASVPISLPGGCRVFDSESLARTGSVAIRFTPEGPIIETDRAVSGDRLWRSGP